VPVCLFYKLILDITLRAFSSPLQEKAKLSSIHCHFSTPALRGSGRTWYFLHASAPHDASSDNWFLFCSQMPSAAAADWLYPHTFFLCARVCVCVCVCVQVRGMIVAEIMKFSRHPYSVCTLGTMVIPPPGRSFLYAAR